MTASTPQPPIDTHALEKLLNAVTLHRDDDGLGGLELIAAAVNALPGLLAHLAAVTTERDTLADRVRALADNEDRLAFVTTGTDHSYWHGRAAKLIRAVVDGPATSDRDNT